MIKIRKACNFVVGISFERVGRASFISLFGIEIAFLPKRLDWYKK